MSDRDPLQSIWTNQRQEPFSMSLDEIHARAQRFQTRVRWRNIREYAASVFVVVYFSWAAVTAPSPLIQIGALLIAAASLYVSWQIYKRARGAAKAALDQAVNLTDFHRAELLRQRAALSTVWRWYLGPFVPGMVVFLAGAAFAPQLEAPLYAKLGVFAFGLVIVGAVFGSIAWLNGLAVKHLDKELAALEPGA